MTLHRTTVTKRLFALLASTSLIMTMGACSSANETQSHETDSPSTAAATDAGNVVIFTPSDGITISQQTPLSKWEKLVPEIVSSLKDNDVKGTNITVKAAPSLDKQSQSVQDYVVNHVNSTSDDADSSDKTTLVVAPVAMEWELLRRRRPGLRPIRGTFGFRIAARSKRGHESRVSVEHAAGFHSGCVRADDHGRADRPASSQTAGQQARARQNQFRQSEAYRSATPLRCRQ